MATPAGGNDAVLLHFERDARAARALAALLGVEAAGIAAHRFPDGETRLALPLPMAREVALYATLHDPNEKLVELLLASRTAREKGARSVALVAPYLCYMRQDVEFEPGQAVSQRVVGRFLADLFDAVITVDPHLHRIDSLSDAVPAKRVVALSAAPLIGEFVHQADPGALLVGPDAESQPWVGAAARQAGQDFAVCTKHRRGDRDVEITLPDRAFGARSVVIVDDMASTGRTIAAAAAALRAAGASSVDVAVTHALFFDDAIETMHAAGVREIWSTDAISHPTNRIALAPLLAAAVRDAGNRAPEAS